MSEVARRVDPRRAPPAVLALAALGLVTTVFALYVGRGTTFFYDDWTFLLQRRGMSADTLLQPHNGNLSLAPIALFKLLLATVGSDSYWVFRAVLLGLHLVVVGLVFVLARKRTGPAPAAVVAGLVLVMGGSADNLLWPAQFGFLLAMVGGLVALVGVDAESRRGDLLATAGLLLALASSSNGVPFVAVVGIQLLWTRASWRRLWVVVVPVVLYGIWSLGYGESQILGSNIVEVPEFGVTMAATAAGTVFGFGVDVGRSLLVVLVLALCVWFIRGGRVDGRLVGLLLGLLAMWTLTPLARAAIEDPTAPRYSYVAVVLILLVAVQAVGRRELPARATSAGVIALAVATLVGAAALSQRGLALRDHSDDVRARLAALALAGPGEPAGFQLVPDQPQILGPGATLVQKDHGRIADTIPELRAADAADRSAADDVLSRLALPVVDPPSQGRTAACRAIPATAPQVTVPPPGRVLRVRTTAGADLPIRVFTDGGPKVLSVPAPGGDIRRAAGRPGVPWIVTVVPGTTVSLCTER